MQPKNAVAILKVIVGHIGDTWVHAIPRQEYFHSMTRNEELAHALRDTYAAHVHNAVTDMFVMDLIREIGAIVLDQNPNSASVAVADQLLSDAAVVDELKKDCQITTPAQWINPSIMERMFCGFARHPQCWVFTIIYIMRISVVAAI
jgi:hypothetical protein